MANNFITRNGQMLHRDCTAKNVTIIQSCASVPPNIGFQGDGGLCRFCCPFRYLGPFRCQSKKSSNSLWRQSPLKSDQRRRCWTLLLEGRAIFPQRNVTLVWQPARVVSHCRPRILISLPLYVCARTRSLWIYMVSRLAWTSHSHQCTWPNKPLSSHIDPTSFGCL